MKIHDRGGITDGVKKDWGRDTIIKEDRSPQREFSEFWFQCFIVA